MVVSIREKGARIKMRHVSIGETSESEPVDEASKEIYRRCQNQDLLVSWEELRGSLFTV
jgi:hypothetical protein